MLNHEPDTALHSGTVVSIMYTNAMLHVPLAVIPSRKSINIVSVIDFDKIIPTLIGTRATYVKSKTGLRPTESAYLGIKIAEIVHPRKKKLPRDPI